MSEIQKWPYTKLFSSSINELYMQDISSIFNVIIYKSVSRLVSINTIFIPAKVFQIVKEDAVKMLHSICQQIWKTQQWPQDWKRSVFIPIPKKGNVKECSNYHTFALISHSSKVMLKILQAKLQQYLNQNFQMYKLNLERQRNQRSNCQHPLDHRKSKKIPGEHLLLLYWLYQSLWLCGSEQTVENSSRDGNTRPPDLPPEKSVCRSRSNS